MRHGSLFSTNRHHPRKGFRSHPNTGPRRRVHGEPIAWNSPLMRALGQQNLSLSQPS